MLISYGPASVVPDNLAPQQSQLRKCGLGELGPALGQKYERVGGMRGPAHGLCLGLCDHSIL